MMEIKEGALTFSFLDHCENGRGGRLSDGPEPVTAFDILYAAPEW